jgi:hypothetical protein
VTSHFPTLVLAITAAALAGCGAHPASAPVPTPACVGRGVEAPEWFREPPQPPPGVFQAEARSGGCTDADQALKAAARAAAWQLAQAASSRIVVEETRSSHRLTRFGGDTQVRVEAEVIESAVAAKILERRWVYRQDTFWTVDGLVEHFLVVRADSTAIRDLVQDPGAVQPGPSVAGYPDRFADAGWESPGAFSRRAMEGERVSDRDRASSRGLREVGRGARPGFRRVVAAWHVALGEPTTADAPIGDRAQRLVAGITLMPASSGANLALGVELATEPAWQVTALTGGGELVRAEREGGAYLLIGAPRSVALYGGARYQDFVVGRDGLGVPVRAERVVGVVGLGFPLFVERSNTAVMNAFAEAVVSPKLDAARIGAVARILDLPGVDVGIATLISGDVLPSVAYPTSGFAPRYAVQRITGEALFEVRLIGALRLGAGWRGTWLWAGAAPEEDRYVWFLQGLGEAVQIGQRSELVMCAGLAL